MPGPVPRWEGQPARTARRVARGYRGGPEAVVHVEMVWRATWMVAAEDELVFWARVARHVERCPWCESAAVLGIWNAEIKKSGVVDILRPFRLERRSRK